ncbi:DUF998 domain-containing protein [Georgenia daeguensis]|uniref:DUF998 domain-containing protein n=1 Tax=Georgenia daeguensis TaxID=908355 RepID=A0ABP8EVM5_9MICO
MTRTMLSCGVVAGALFVATTAVQAVTREGFDLRRHGISLLSHGDLGWVQTTNFVVSGLLVAGFAVGVSRMPHPGGRGALAAPLLGVAGLGLVLAGSFRVRSYGGFPAGAAPAGPSTAARDGLLHDVGTVLAINAGLLACLALARRFARSGERGWARYSVVTAVAGAALAWWPFGGTAVRLALVTVVLMSWVSLVAARLLREQDALRRGAAGLPGRRSARRGSGPPGVGRGE